VNPSTESDPADAPHLLDAAAHPFTVAISTLDRAEILAETLDTLRDVDLSLVAEVLVVDQSDEPLDPTPWRDSLPLRVVAQAGRGLGRSRNEVLRQAKTPLILFIDDDVVPDPKLVTEHWKVYESHPRALGVAGFEHIARDEVRRSWRAFARRGLVWLLRPYLRTRAAYRPFLDEAGHPVGLVMRSGLFLCQFDRPSACRVMTPRGCNMSFRREALTSVGGFDEAWDGPRRDESDLSLRLLEHCPGAEIWFNPEARVQHWMRPTGGCRQGSVQEKRRRDVLCEIRFARRHLALAGRSLSCLRLLVTRAGWWLRDPVLLTSILGTVVPEAATHREEQRVT